MVKFEIEGEKDEEPTLTAKLVIADNGVLWLVVSDGNSRKSIVGINPRGRVVRSNNADIPGIKTNGCYQIIEDENKMED